MAGEFTAERQGRPITGWFNAELEAIEARTGQRGAATFPTLLLAFRTDEGVRAVLPTGKDATLGTKTYRALCSLAGRKLREDEIPGFEAKGRRCRIFVSPDQYGRNTVFDHQPTEGELDWSPVPDKERARQYRLRQKTAPMSSEQKNAILELAGSLNLDAGELAAMRLTTTGKTSSTKMTSEDGAKLLRHLRSIDSGGSPVPPASSRP